MQFNHPRTRDPNRPGLDRRGFVYPHTSSSLPHHSQDAIPFTATPHRSLAYKDRYTPVFGVSTPSSSPTTASSSPPPPTSPLAYGSYRARADAIDIRGREHRDSSPYAHHPYAHSAGPAVYEHSRFAGRYAYVKSQEQLYEESDYDDMRECRRSLCSLLQRSALVLPCAGSSG